MSVIAGMFTGTLVGIYFAEKNVAFPVRYNRRPNGSPGSLEFDLEIFDVVTRDLKRCVGYRDKREMPGEQAEPHI